MALVAGPLYEPLYALLPEFEAKAGKRVHVAARLALPELHAHLDEAYRSGAGAYDLISTHSRYAPAQKHFLRPLDDWFREGELNEFAPALLEMSRAEGWLLSLPRNLEVRLLHLRRDLLEDPNEQAQYRQTTGRELRPPATWEELAQVAKYFARPPELFGFAFPACQSELFGTFSELVAMAGGKVFRPDLRPGFVDSAGRWALGFLRRLYLEDRVTPAELPEMRVHDVSQLFLSGRCAMATDGPGSFGRSQDPAFSRVAEKLDFAPYPLGPAGERWVWAGAHAFAIPTSVRNEEGARALLKFLVSPDAQWQEARQGDFPALKSVQTRQKAETSADSLAGRRLALLEQTVASQMLLPPRWACYPRVEQAACAAFRKGMTGEWSVDDALHNAAAEMEKIAAT